MKKPYIRKYAEISGFSVWIVDGWYIRTHMDEEFTNFGQHYRFKFIPKNEFWIDKEHGGEDEAGFFIQNMLVQHRLASVGVSYDRVMDISDMVEKKERRKQELIERESRMKPTIELANKVHKLLLKKYSGRVKVWVVNGRLVRDFFFIDFTEGGHDRVYPFVPENEVWIDDDVNPKERKFVLLHELHERRLMSEGWQYFTDRAAYKGVSPDGRTKKYRGAHESASDLEYFYRHHPQGLDKRLKKEVENA